MSPGSKRVLAAGLLGLGSLHLAGATWFGDAPNGFRPTLGCGEAYQVGKALFVAKGRVTCHPHAQVEYAGVRVGVGPDLTGVGRAGSGVPPGPEYLRAWLKNPQAVRPQTHMPNLGLSDQEIDYLWAFLLNSPSWGGRRAVLGLDFNPGTACPAGRLLPAGMATMASEQPCRDAEGGPVCPGEKFWCWSAEFPGRQAEPVLDPVVTARRLDGEAPEWRSQLAANGYHPCFHWAMLVGGRLPTPGCWEFTARYWRHELKVVVWVP